jgi:DNA invertase Pin-like site-specific DNA recombinase
MINIYAAVAQEERRMIAERTRVGLAAAKARGVVLGGPKLPQINATRQEAAVARARAIEAHLVELANLSTREAAAELNRRGVPTSSGKPWLPMAVLRARKRLAN